MTDNWYDTAQICTSGHVINWMSTSKPEYNRKFCDRCGVPTITNCPNCNTPIRGYYHKVDLAYEELDTMVNEILNPPPETTPDYTTVRSFCPDCGKPYPWTEAKLKAAQEFADMLEELSPEERDLLKKSLDDIVLDTPQTPVAANRIKMLAAKVSKVLAEQLRELVVDIASETAKKIFLE